MIRSAGRAQPRVLRARSLISSATRCSSSGAQQAVSLEPRCHGECASQKYTRVPVRAVRHRQVILKWLWHSHCKVIRLLNLLSDCVFHAAAAAVISPQTAKRFCRTLLKGLRYVPRVIVTDKLASYRLAHRALVASVTHRRSKYLNNRGRELPSADQGPRTGDETLRLTWAGPAIRVCVRKRPRALSAPSSSDQRIPVANRDARPFRGLARNHSRCSGMKDTVSQ